MNNKSKITKMDDHWKDAEGSRSYFHTFGSEKKALEALQSLEGCEYCTDCFNCTGCTLCVDCTDCKGCIYLRDVRSKVND